MAFLVIYMIIKVDGKPVINYGFVSSKAFNWGTIFMVAAAVYGAGTLTAESTGVKQLIIDLLNPILLGFVLEGVEKQTIKASPETTFLYCHCFILHFECFT
jgi:hypothetical protein